MIQGKGFTAHVRLQEQYRANTTLLDYSCRFDPMVLIILPPYTISSELIPHEIQESQFFINTNYLSL